MLKLTINHVNCPSLQFSFSFKSFSTGDAYPRRKPNDTAPRHAVKLAKTTGLVRRDADGRSGGRSGVRLSVCIADSPVDVSGVENMLSDLRLRIW